MKSILLILFFASYILGVFALQESTSNISIRSFYGDSDLTEDKIANHLQDFLTRIHNR